MSDIDPEGFQRGGETCTCGPLYSYGGHIEPGQCNPTCPEHSASSMSAGEFAAIEARASAVADAFHDDVPLELDTYVWKYAPGQQKRFTSIRGEQGEIAAVEGWEPDTQAGITALIDAVTVAREDVPALLAAVRERDNTIARVRDIVESVHVSDGLDPDGYQVAGLIRAALDPQETP